VGGRIIYAGIQKFVAFIMSVHIAEVIQIFFCIVAGVPVMRTPLQILFLILVTDLPPSIALGMEPGDKSIIKQQPRPKSEPIVLGWMWASIMMNGVILSSVIIFIYILALHHYCDGYYNQDEIIRLVHNYEFKLAQARTVAFIALVYAENIRAYIARYFDKPFWTNLCGNWQMQKAIILAQIALYIAVLVPVLSDEILKLNGMDIGAWGWAMSLIGPVATLLLCELAKIITYFQAKWYDRRLRNQREKQLELQLQAATKDQSAPTATKTLLMPQQKQNEPKPAQIGANNQVEQPVIEV